jgi:hypothetical protein
VLRVSNAHVSLCAPSQSMTISTTVGITDF